MSLYGSYIEEGTKYSDESFLEEYIEIMETTMDYLFEKDDEDFVAESELYMLTEGKTGSTGDIVKKINVVTKEYKAKVKELNKLIKAANKSRNKEDYDKAKKKIDELISLLKQYKAEIAKIDASSVLDIFTGFMVKQIGVLIAATTGAIVGSVTGIGIGLGLKAKYDIKMTSGISAKEISIDMGKRVLKIIGFTVLMSSIKDIISGVANAIKDKDPRKLNVYRTEAIKIIDEFIMNLTKVKNQLETVLFED